MTETVHLTSAQVVQLLLAIGERVEYAAKCLAECGGDTDPLHPYWQGQLDSAKSAQAALRG